MVQIAVEQMIARTLGIDVKRVNDDLMYQSIPEWDSLRHVALIVALEEEFGTPVNDDLVLELRSVAAIREFIGAQTSGSTTIVGAPSVSDTARSDEPSSVTIYRGLDGVHVDRSTITYIGGETGVLEYRGYSIHDLAERSSFEETAWLLLHSELPTAAALNTFTEELRAQRALPAPVLDIVRALAQAHPMEVLRTGVSALGTLTSDPREESPEAALAAGVRLIAQVPTLIAAHQALRNGREPVAPRPTLSHAANFLHMLFGEEPSASVTRFIDKGLIVHADHSANASTFTARVAIGSKANLHAAITAAIGTFSGALHGGAAERVVELIDVVGQPEHAAAYVRRCFEQNQPVMGFGHRVYRTEDPRVRHLRATTRQLSQERGDMRGIAIIEAVIEAMKPYARHGIEPNVDLYAGLSYRLLRLPDDLAVPMFVAGRMAGWVAQALEQKRNNVLIRPLLQYVGATSRTYTPISER